MSQHGKLYKIRRKLQVVFYDISSPEIVSRVYFRIVMGYKLNLKNPKTFNEKLQWLKLRDWPTNELAIKCADKYRVREYIKEKKMGNTLNKLIGVWDNADEIDFDKLPEQFALKCNHGCGYNVIVSDKSKIDVKEVRQKLNKWLKEDFGKNNAEPHYSKIKPKIICEKYLGGNMTDYKFFCLNGKVEFMYIASGFGEGVDEKMTYLDKNGKIAPYQRTSYKRKDDIVVPKNFEKMKKMSELLAKDFKFVRVDWYEVDGKIFFGELTFTPAGCMMKIEPAKYDKLLGDKLKI